MMGAVDMSKSVAQQIEEGQDPQEVAGFVGVVLNGQYLYGIINNIHGVQSAFEDGTRILEWWSEEWNKQRYTMWDEDGRLIIQD